MEDDRKYNRYGITPFAGTDFGNWIYRVQVILEEHELAEYAFKDSEEKDKKKASKCKSILVQCVADSHLELIKECQTARNIVVKLKETFQRKGIASQLLTRKQLLTLKYKENTNMEEFFLHFDKLIRKLKETEAKPSESEICCYLLLAMPESFAIVVAAIETMNSSEININFIKNRLLDEEIKRKGFEKKEEERNVFINFKKEKDRKLNKKFPFECYNCGKVGHKKSECKFNNFRKFNNKRREANYIEKQEICLLTDYSNIRKERNPDSVYFYVDSGASDHLVNTEKHFSNSITLSSPITINIAKKEESLVATKMGTIVTKECKLLNVLYVPNLRSNLLSINRLENSGFGVMFQNNRVVIYRKKGQILKTGYKRNNLYEMEFFMKKNVEAHTAYSSNEKNWHEALGHASTEKLKELKRRKLINYTENDEILCEPCLKGRQTKRPFINYKHQTKRVLQVIHTDLCGPLTPATYDDKRYILTLIDDYSNFATVYLLEQKSQALQYFKEYVSYVEAKFNTKISRLRCDNGTEFNNKLFKDFCKEKGINIEFTMIYTPQQNGKSERFNRTLVEKIRTLLASVNIEKELWGEAAYTATYIINRLPTSAGKIPSEFWYGQTPNYNKMKPFGIETYAYIPKQYRTSKLDEKSKRYILIGYTNNGYRLWDPEEKKIIKSRDVVFNENKKEQKIIYIEENDNCIEKKNEEIKDKEENVILPKEKELHEENEKEIPKAPEDKRTRRKPDRYGDWTPYYDDSHGGKSTAFSAEVILNNAPSTLEEALSSQDKEKWQKAINEELKSHKIHQTWEIVEKPKNKPVIDSRWVFRIKNNNSYKARLVAKGFQSDNFQETYAPVGKLTTLRTLLVIANKEQLFIEQMDVKTAFLHGQLKEEIYMNLPGERSENVCKLKKSIYGLKQSPRCWNEAFHNYISEKKFKCSEFDNCLYIGNSCKESKRLLLFLYVDDILLISDSENRIKTLKSELSEKFEMLSLGPVKMFLGIEIERDFNKKIIKLHQKTYINCVLERFNMKDCKSVSTPCEVGLKLDKADTYMCTQPYRELIGCLIYLVSCTRPDLSFAVNYFSRFQNNASDEHYTYLKRILRYLKLTVEYGLVYTDNAYDRIALGYCDADWAGDLCDRKSVSGYCILLFGNVISWCTQKQKTVSLSTAEAEYLSLSLICCECTWFKGLLGDLEVHCLSITILEDNQSCIHIAKNRENSKRVKHIDIKHHFIRNLIENETILLEYIATNEQIADIFTKPLCRNTFHYFRNKLGVLKC